MAFENLPEPHGALVRRNAGQVGLLTHLTPAEWIGDDSEQPAKPAASGLRDCRQHGNAPVECRVGSDRMPDPTLKRISRMRVPGGNPVSAHRLHKSRHSEARYTAVD